MLTKRSPIRLGKDEYKKLCILVFRRDNRKCRVCKLRLPLHAHHIVFRSHGGDDTIFNLLTVCNECHEAIHARHVIVMPVEDSGELNANLKLKFMLVNGWLPKTNHGKTRFTGNKTTTYCVLS